MAHRLQIAIEEAQCSRTFVSSSTRTESRSNYVVKNHTACHGTAVQRNTLHSLMQCNAIESSIMYVQYRVP